MTFRNQNIKTEYQGVRYVQGVVQDNHSIYHPFARENDQGNDCYIEFVQNGLATNYGVLVQIKSGPSYKDSQGYKIPANIDHLTYWNNGLYLSVGIVYDPEIKKAFWVDITSYLKDNPHVLRQKHHSIRVDETNEFSEQTFSIFMNYCFRYKNIFTSYENYGRSLEWFARLNEPDICYEGLKSLYSNHRDKASTWFYIITNFSKIQQKGIRGNILGLLSNYANNSDVFWNSSNLPYYPSEEMQSKIFSLMTRYFRKEEVLLTLSYMQMGINKGSFSFLVFLVINFVEDIHLLLKEISFSDSIDDDLRNFCIWLYMQIAKFISIEETLETIDLYLLKFPIGYNDEVVMGVRESIQNRELLPVG